MHQFKERKEVYWMSLETNEKPEVIEPPKSLVREILEWIVCIFVAFALAVFIKYFLFTPTLVMQESMTPTILNGQRVLINRLPRTFHLDLQYGDIVTFEAPSNVDVTMGEVVAKYREPQGWAQRFFYYVLEKDKISYIKRVVGLPGDHIVISAGNVYRNDELVSEPYLQKEVKTYMPIDTNMPNDFIVPEGYVFAMGDNRSGSSDCRQFGCIPLEKVEGRVSIRIWPLSAFGKIDS